MPIIAFITIAIGCFLFLLMLYFSVVSWREEEPRAARRALALALLLPVPYIAAGLIDFSLQTTVCFLLVGVTLLVLIILLLPIGNSPDPDDDTPQIRIDERDIMFSRRLLVEGSDRFNEYYERHPELRTLDDVFRSHPGLLREGTLYYDPVTSAAANASFRAVTSFHSGLDQETLQTPLEKTDPVRMTRFIKQWTKKLGAVSVGITELKDYHMYSTIGRGDRYGEPVDLNHKYAIALTVEMDKCLLDRAPRGPTVMESAQQYLNSGAIAVQVAEFIRQLGYSSRAHIDGSYRVVCPLVARDAGLGEIGRMGLLMTPELGPRVRLAVVTADLVLVPDEGKRDYSVIDFCRRCKKCADACPSRAISVEDRVEINGVLRWQIDSESCFTYWCKVGTDCGRCISVCPYSHPDHVLHNAVRAGLRRSALFRKVALKLDDYFYGRKPPPLKLPDWIGGVVESSN